MSLHSKIVAWLVFFASLVVALFVLGDYYQSTRALRAVLEARAGALANQTLHEVERRYERTEAELLAFGYATSQSGAADPGVVGRYASLRVFENDALRFDHVAAGPTDPGDRQGDARACADGMVHFRVEFAGASGVQKRVEASMPGTEFFAFVPSTTVRLGRGGATAVLRSRDGSVVYDHMCRIAGDGSGPTFAHEVRTTVSTAAMAGFRSLQYADLEQASPRGSHVLAIARGERPDWSVAVVVDYNEFAAPFVRLRMQYLAGTLAVVLIALLLILRMIRSDMRRFRIITQAADSIGRGQFNVWLPPPTGDDVGRLSMALGRMANRLSSTLHQMEISRSMAAVGELASYLSHEIRNPLSSIRLNLQMLGRDLRKGTVPDDGEELLRLCLAELQRLDDVVKTVLEVGRRQDGAAGACDAHGVIEQTMRVMRPKLAAHGVAPELRLDALRADVQVDGTRLKSIVINLLLNAVEAMAESEQKRIMVATALLEGATEDDAVFELRVADTGPGVPAHLREKIFEPFFTTKASGNGIGLATVMRILQDCGGVMRYAPSEWTEGAEFVLELPLAGSSTITVNDTPELVEAGR